MTRDAANSEGWLLTAIKHGPGDTPSTLRWFAGMMLWWRLWAMGAFLVTVTGALLLGVEHYQFDRYTAAFVGMAVGFILSEPLDKIAP
jgi:hypothetical protein